MRGGGRGAGGGGGPKQSAINGHNRSDNASGSGSSNGSHRRYNLQEGVELTREPWRQGRRVSNGWEAVRSSAGDGMGGANGKDARGVGGSTGYEVVEREEPLLDGEVDDGGGGAAPASGGNER